MKPLLRFLFPVLLAALFGPAFAQSGNPADAKKSYVHRLQLADRVRVAVYQEEDLTTLTRIDARGMINLPLIQEIQIGGLTIVEAQDAIQNAFREGRFLRSPQVTVSVEEYAPREVSISGQIRNPGRFPLPNESTYTIVELVTKAGGITDIGKGTAVTITRFLADGTKKVFSVNVDALIKGAKDAKAEDNILLLPGDNVYVPERLI